ncbi:hypothetical protein M9H77_36765 [Catharanthus roseus]|uniref:Uncharacterized protein n=1 Tax=Catharanthus roseus TaxID=4058 RepID=A0ACB9ZTM1_CATRO|nr:hypothetical protein M9H77_36765 [Catharanthus roseus]
MDTPDHLYVIANTFNFCVVLIAQLGSTTAFPLYSNMDLQLRDGCPLPPMQVQCNIIEILSSFSTSSRKASLATKSKRASAGIEGSIATVPPQISSSPHTSCCLPACVPPELSSYPAAGECPAVYVHSYNPTWDTAGCRTCKHEFPV